MKRILAVLVLFASAAPCFAAGQWEKRLIENSDGKVFTSMVPEWAMSVYLYEDDTTYTVYDLNGGKPMNPPATYFNCPKWAHPPWRKDQ